MSNYKGILAITIISLLILISLIFIIVNLNNTVSGEIISSGSQTNENPVSQVLKWDHMPLTYSYNEQCASYYNGNYPLEIKKTLDYITEKTDNSITFQKVENNADINFICQINNENFMRNLNDERYITAEAVSESNEKTNIFNNGTIYIYSTKNCLGKRPVVLIHETLHLLGLEHSETFKIGNGQSKDIMLDMNTNCFADITEKDTKHLKKIYSNKKK
ncbi:MAG: matrixin family metalloprotease [Nanoarchaeota archaeon]